MNQIYIIAFVDSSAISENNIFQQWGNRNEENLFWYYSNISDSSDFQAVASNFNITNLSTVVAIEVTQEDPVEGREVKRFEGTITSEKLDKLLVDAQQEIGSPIIGGGGNTDNNDNNSNGSGGNASRFGFWLLGLLGVAIVVSKSKKSRRKRRLKLENRKEKAIQ